MRCYRTFHNYRKYFYKISEAVTDADETDKIVDAIKENAKNINKLLKDRKHPDPETLLKHVSSDDTVSTNVSVQTDLESNGMKQAEIGALNADITEMEKIKSVGKCKLLVVLRRELNICYNYGSHRILILIIQFSKYGQKKNISWNIA